MMDLKGKGMAWVENLYQKFEAVCQEVNDIVSQDTKKYVGNQVSTVSESMIKFCSEVVQEAQAASVKKIDVIDIYTGIEKKNIDVIDNYTGIENNPIGSSIQQSPMEEILLNPVETQQGHAFTGLDLENQLITSPSVDCLEGSESGLISEKSGDFLANELVDISVEQNAMEGKSSVPEVLELISPEERESVEASLFSEFFDDKQLITSPSVDCLEGAESGLILEKSGDILANDLADISVEEQAMEEKSSVPEVLELISPEERESVEASLFSEFVDDKQLITSPSVDCLEGTESGLISGKSGDILANELADVSVEENAMGEKSSVPELLEIISPEDGKSFKASPFSDFVDDSRERLMAEVSPITSVKDAEFESRQKEGTCGTTFSGVTDCVSDTPSTPISFEMDFPVVSCEKQIIEMKPAPSKSSLVTESYHPFENSSDNLPTSAVLCNNRVNVAGYDSNCSSALRSPKSELVVSGSKAVERGLLSSSSALSLESLAEEDVSRTRDALPLTELSGNWHHQFHYSTQFKAGNSSDIGCSDGYISDIADEEMETIQLFDKLKSEESCITVDSCELYAVSRRAQHQRSYKKIIQDVFAKKKRLVKEYEQLAILHGDIDFNAFHETSQSVLPSTSTALLDSNPTTEPEWEIL